VEVGARRAAEGDGSTRDREQAIGRGRGRAEVENSLDQIAAVGETTAVEDEVGGVAAGGADAAGLTAVGEDIHRDQSGAAEGGDVGVGTASQPALCAGARLGDVDDAAAILNAAEGGACAVVVAKCQGGSLAAAVGDDAVVVE